MKIIFKKLTSCDGLHAFPFVRFVEAVQMSPLVFPLPCLKRSEPVRALASLIAGQINSNRRHDGHFWLSNTKLVVTVHEGF